MEIVTVAAKTYLLIGGVLSALALSGHIPLEQGGMHYRDAIEFRVNRMLRNDPELRSRIPECDRPKFLQVIHFFFLVWFMLAWLPMLLIPIFRGK